MWTSWDRKAEPSDFGTITRLPRYDANTLQPIRQRPPDFGTYGGQRFLTRRPLISTDLYTVPRPSEQWAVAPLAEVRQSPPPPPPDLPDTIRSFRTPFIQTAPSETPTKTAAPNGGPISPAAPISSVVKFDWAERLLENYHIGVHRLVFLIRRFPALAALVVAIFVLFGRRDFADFPLSKRESNQNLVVFVAALITQLGILFGLRNHSNNPQAALNQVLVRLGALFASFLADLAALVFGILAIILLASESESELPQCFPRFCFSLKDRVIQSAVLLGLSVICLLLTIFSAVHGITAIYGIWKDRRIEKRSVRRGNAELAAYNNPLAVQKFY